MILPAVSGIPRTQPRHCSSSLGRQTAGDSPLYDYESMTTLPIGNTTSATAPSPLCGRAQSGPCWARNDVCLSSAMRPWRLAPCAAGPGATRSLPHLDQRLVSLVLVVCASKLPASSCLTLGHSHLQASCQQSAEVGVVSTGEFPERHSPAAGQIQLLEGCLQIAEVGVAPASSQREAAG